jgi:hypothetical protein
LNYSVSGLFQGCFRVVSDCFRIVSALQCYRVTMLQSGSRIVSELFQGCFIVTMLQIYNVSELFQGCFRIKGLHASSRHTIEQLSSRSVVLWTIQAVV